MLRVPSSESSCRCVSRYVAQGIIISTGDVEKLNEEVQELSTDYKPMGADADTATLLVTFQLQVSSSNR